jgi:hypothetical protein
MDKVNDCFFSFLKAFHDKIRIQAGLIINEK